MDASLRDHDRAQRHDAQDSGPGTAAGKVPRVQRATPRTDAPTSAAPPAPAADVGAVAPAAAESELDLLTGGFAAPAAAVEAVAPIFAHRGSDRDVAPKARGKAGGDEDKASDGGGGGGATAAGAVIGGLLGGALGAVVGGGVGAVIGGAVGAVVGGALGALVGGDEDAKAGGATAVPSGPAYAPAAVVPNFILDKKVDPRSNTKSSTQSASDPTCTGHAAVDAAAKVWRYQLTGVESKGKIRIVYFTADHYPAPTPTDDSGALSNVTSGNWQTIVTDLEANKAGIPDFWSAYQAEDVHELYHWEVEWQGEVKKELLRAEAEIAKLSLGFDQAATATDAEKTLAPQARAIFDAAMTRARAAYNALGDSPGDPPYRAQVPVVEALIKRVNDHASAQGW
jgi:hypothetical protein